MDYKIFPYKPLFRDKDSWYSTETHVTSSEIWCACLYRCKHILHIMTVPIDRGQLSRKMFVAEGKEHEMRYRNKDLRNIHRCK